MERLKKRTFSDVSRLDEYCRKLFVKKDIREFERLLPQIEEERERCDKEFNKLCKDVLSHQIGDNKEITAAKNQLALELGKQKIDIGKISSGVLRFIKKNGREL